MMFNQGILKHYKPFSEYYSATFAGTIPMKTCRFLFPKRETLKRYQPILHYRPHPKVLGR